MKEVDLSQLGFQERRDLQEWVANNPSILGEELLVIGKEFSGFDRTNDRLDLLAVDTGGKLVVIELKRDDSGADAHWQAIKYASYLHRVDTEGIIRMFADYAEISAEEAADRLLKHLNSDDLNGLNNEQRIILVSHRFAPEVTSAALWLNEKASVEDFMTCVQLTPYQDAEAGSLYIQANTIIPVPGVDDYVIGIGDSSDSDGSVVRTSGSLTQTFARNRTDDITRFLREVADLTVERLPDSIRPDRKSRWAGRASYMDMRYYHLWYSRPNWGNWDMTYYVHLFPQAETSETKWQADVGFAYWNSGIENLESRLEELHVHDDQKLGYKNDEFLVLRHGNALDVSFAEDLSKALSRFIEVVTPAIKKLEDANNEEDA